MSTSADSESEGGSVARPPIRPLAGATGRARVPAWAWRVWLPLILAPLAVLEVIGAPAAAQVPEWVTFLGRFHPMIVHFPLAWIILAALAEFLQIPKLRTWLPPLDPSWIRWLWGLAAFSALISVCLGYLLAWSGGYDRGLLQWHLRLAVITAAGSVLIFAQGSSDRQGTFFVRWVGILLTVEAMTLAGHFGASLTHGSNYLSEYAPRFLRPFLSGKPPFTPPSGPETSAQPAVSQVAAGPFKEVVRPALTRSCLSCHGPEKAKGGLRMDSYAGLLRGGKHGAVVIPGNPEQSEMIKRIHLPEDDDDHMPPAGKTPPSPADLQALEAWIRAGAPEH